MLELNKIYNIDCMELMKEFPDKYFELAIVDPPYGINKAFHATSRIAKYGQTKTVNGLKPTKEYFNELFRVSKNQIIWGYNYLSDMLPSAKEFIFWFKHQPVKTYSDGELAWTSFKGTARCFDYPYWGSINADAWRFHPTQKPIALYTWILNEYAKTGDKILDTHAGSGSSLCAAYIAGFDFIGSEIYKPYYTKAKEHLDSVMSQISFFDSK